MVKLRMRTKFLLSMLLISAGLTCTSLLLVRRSVQSQVKRGLFSDLHNSVGTFQSFQRERELTLTHSAALMADLPDLRALMTTRHEATIQDAADHLWRLAGSDLFVLADRTGKVVALHTASPGLSHDMAQQSLSSSLNQEGPQHWWFGGQHLYEVFLKPIYFGTAAENRLLGFLVVGYEIDDRVASQVSRIAASQVAFYYGDSIVRTTLSPFQEAELTRQHTLRTASGLSEPQEVQLGDERFLGTSLEFTFTRPLGSLVAGVRALEVGDFRYSLDARGSDEVAEVTRAFKGMRDSLLKTQQELLEAERLATIGRMASSISHDLRHSLAAIVANAEFLCESRLSTEQREELYQEVRVAVNQMTDLIDSLLEFSRTRESLRLTYANVKDTVEHAVQTIHSHPEFHHVRIAMTQQGNSTGWFDPKKLERALYNLLLNACEAVASQAGEIEVELREVSGGVEIRVCDNGRGIPEPVQGKLFEPFVSYGKENGTGLGLTVVQKIVQDHGGDVTVEKTSVAGTVFRVLLPLAAASETTTLPGREAKPAPPLMARTKQVQSE